MTQNALKMLGATLRIFRSSIAADQSIPMVRLSLDLFMNLLIANAGKTRSLQLIDTCN